ncbi:MAG: DNA internalization-related competence protein ComEC/Rec2 [Candidatus Paralactobacillus gallistercoris]|uniref:DNA internalization-related competence protein ComEC/Rec2 n=1 Tax=Candidatus Paralactobacillus gallistercoris TaxID=2838724 RepID=A0A948TJD1_9LACO|nr:DNA internalization-related competence protein ComEC/Rec2 [Candidatus Paralactobacillus gallistercoris]
MQHLNRTCACKYELDPSNLLFLPALVTIFGTYCGLAATHRLWYIVVLIIIIMRIVRTHNISILLLSLALLGIVILRCMSWQRLNQPLCPTSKVIKVLPDAWQNNGQQVKFIGTTMDHQRVSGVIYLKKCQQRWYYQRLTQPCWLVTNNDYYRITAATNEAEFDYARYLWQQHHIAYAISLKKPPLLYHCPVSSLNDRIHCWRKYFWLYLQKLPFQCRYHAQSLLLGSNDGAGYSYRRDLSKLGVIHLFSLSGLHFFILLHTLLLLGNYCGITKECLEWCFLIILPCYAIIAGGNLSISRAVLLAWLTIITHKIHWSCSRLSLWSMVIIINLLWQPYTLFTLGGCLSYLLSLVIIVTHGQSIWRQHVIIYLMSTPLIWYFNFKILTLSLLVNVIFAPVFNYLLLPLVYITGLLGPCLPWLAIGSEYFLTKIVIIIKYLASLPWLVIIAGRLSLLELLLLLTITFYWLLCYLKHRHRILSVLLCYLAVISMHRYPWEGRVVFFDIGQGDAILLEGKQHQYNVLIDTGGKLRFNHQQHSSRAEQVIVNYLHSRGITHLDAVIVSYQDADHIGDLPVILRQCHVREVVFAKGLLRNQSFVKKIKPFIAKTRLHPVLAGDTLHFGQQTLQVLAPTHPGLGTNHDSLVIYAVIAQQRWLFTGDLDRAGELQLLQRYPQLQIDYLKVGHHGSRTSSAPIFIKKIKPRLALILAGRHNRYGHPHTTTLMLLKRNKIPYLNTAQVGMITYHYSNFCPAFWQTYRK